MKTLWKILLGIGAIIAAVFAMSSKGSKKQFKADIKENEGKLKDTRKKTSKLKKEKDIIKKTIKAKEKQIKESRKKINSVDSTKARETVSNFEKKYRSKK